MSFQMSVTHSMTSGWSDLVLVGEGELAVSSLFTTSTWRLRTQSFSPPGMAYSQHVFPDHHGLGTRNIPPVVPEK